MSGVYHLVLFFFIFHLVIFSLAQEENGSSPKCQSFVCGILNQIGFPFSNETFPKCGFLTVKGCKEQVQRIQLEKNGPEFQVLSISKDNTLSLSHPRGFRNPPLGNKSCVDYLQNLTIPSSNFLSFEVNPKNQTLFRCPGKPYTVGVNFTSLCDGSRDSIVYYSGTKPGGSSAPPQDCSLILFQSNKNEKVLHFSNLFTGWFQLQVIVTSECRKCHHRGGTCRFDNNGEFQCPGARSDKKKLLAIGIGIGASTVLIVVLLVWFFQQKFARFKAGFTSSNPSSNSELQLGGAYFGVPIFSYAELAEATNNFSERNEIGDGGFGTVYYGKLRDEREVAVKRLYEHNYRKHQHFLNEIEILTRLRHKNLVSLYGCTSRDSPQGLFLVYEYVSNGTVADHLHGNQAKPSPLTWPIRLNIAIETANALVYLHASDIIHRDIKTHNILLDNNFCVKVADFGLSRWFPNNVTHVSTTPQGSPGYLDPEYYQFYQLTEKSDVYSFGVVLIELISSMPAVDINRHRHEVNLANYAMNRIQNCATEELIDPSLGYQSDEEVRRMTTSVAELAFLCLQQNKEMRPAMDEVLEELKRIESGDSNLKSVQQPPDCDDFALLKHSQVPSSPISETSNWVSSDTTSNVSG
ncbi:LEAF RUST 10 DISEASE-RESISTANCE LOCUS RECEPTOR-LIKE PROTEIN KINASE-like 1.1 [Mangifera indica]|uniref:LEAF RUST 10 DISEASE-RESISTANCE LOCUS RECEPTOR-LIKE PROTEIN KINASE-like 1.1 n=1 Tax=Mangifera indica TaxID=29780 RepID=UPI001CFB65AB|nr:LEAF RUST 10 DISEASE-RESISTANCE LOCUS RECEPTOR-LIKE PROTEIN KINASE-like 1.1 [Mangifera indica]